MEVVLHQDVFTRDDGGELWALAARGQRRLDMPYAPQVGSEILSGTDIVPTRVDKVCYVVQTGFLHAYLDPINVSGGDVQAAINGLENRGFEIQTPQ